MAGQTILLIEDDAAIAEMYTTRLQQDGFRVSIAIDGLSAIRSIAGSRPNLVYLDVHMPGLDGLQVLESIARGLSTARVPVIMLTNYSEPRTIARALGLGAKDFLVKSQTTPADLAAHARRWLPQAVPDRAGCREASEPAGSSRIG